MEFLGGSQTRKHLDPKANWKAVSTVSTKLLAFLRHNQ
jgi:hypothetical protein